MINNLPEFLRKQIDVLIEESPGSIILSPELKQTLSSICFTMYMEGFKQAIRLSKTTLDRHLDWAEGRDV